MTDTASLRQAAEMIIATGTDKDWFDTIDAGALRLADAWLAEHPADNDDPATAEWMLTLPGAKRIDAFAVEVAGDGWRISLLHGQAGEFWFAQGRGIWPGRPVTRGMVRRLMAALN